MGAIAHLGILAKFSAGVDAPGAVERMEPGATTTGFGPQSSSYSSHDFEWVSALRRSGPDGLTLSSLIHTAKPGAEEGMGAGRGQQPGRGGGPLLSLSHTFLSA